MRESHRDSVHGRWVLSTNRPYRLVGSLWLLNGTIFTVDATLLFGLYFGFPASFLPWIWEILALLLTVEAIYAFAGGGFLRHDSRTIHKDPFPEGSTCSEHPSQLAYDWCAICGALKCTQDLVRIRQSLRFSPGMFGFDGVACQRCAQRRVKRLRAVVAGLQFVTLPLVAAIVALMSLFLPAPLSVVLLIILAAIILTLLPLGVWAWRRGWRTVTTPLSTQPLLVTPTAQRLAEKATVGDSVRFKRVAPLGT
jgi:hypothetical protein